MAKTIFITGASRGFGRVWAEAALKRGDNVIATARNLSTLDSLQQKYGSSIFPIQLDVNNREDGIAAIQKGFHHFGRLDVVINNAGYGLFGAIEEASEADARAQMETNFFGPLWITQAAIPIMRQQRSGHIIQVSSIGGLLTLPILGIYHASKFALEAFSESLSQEISQFGINVTIVEPGGYETDWLNGSSKKSNPINAYDRTKEYFNTVMGSQNFDPEHTGPAMLKLIDAENPPIRVLFGNVWPVVKTVYEERIKVWEQWLDLSISAS